MKVAYIKNWQDIIVRNIEPGSVGNSEIRVKVDACGICGTDVASAQIVSDEYRSFGHEIAGTIVEVGKAVNSLAVGQTVVLESSSACGRCSQCRNAQQQFCSNIQSFWPKATYGFAEEIVCPAICAVPYDEMSAELACLAEPLGVALDMVKLADIRLGDTVLVSGLGPIGLMTIRLAQLAGAERVYACDLSRVKRRLEIAGNFGAEVIAVDKETLAAEVLKDQPNRILASSPPSTLPALMDIAARGAIISYIGISPEDKKNVTFDANLFHFNKLQLRGSFASPALFIPEALHLLQGRFADAQKLISHVFSLDEIDQAMQVASCDTAEVVKVIIKPALKRPLKQ